MKTLVTFKAEVTVTVEGNFNLDCSVRQVVDDATREAVRVIRDARDSRGNEVRIGGPALQSVRLVS